MSSTSRQQAKDDIDKNNVFEIHVETCEELLYNHIQIISEAVSILGYNSFYKDEKSYGIAIDIVTHMHKIVDKHRFNAKVNYSLLASPGEMISGRFCEVI